MFKKHKRESLTLRRDLGLFDATLAGVGIIVGAGIYVLIGAAAGYAGNAIWIAFIISAIAAFLTGLSYAELSSIYPNDSAEYSYAHHTFGKAIAFVTGYLVMISLVLAGAAVSLGFGGYLSKLIGVSGMIVPIAIASIAVFSIVNYIGIKLSMKLNVILTALSIIGLLFIIVFSIGKYSEINYYEAPFGIGGIFKAASLIFFAFIGFETVVKLSEETKNPRKTIPLALLLSLGISSILYILVSFSAIRVYGWEKLSQSSAPLSDVAFSLLGNNAWLFISVIAIVSTGNTVLLNLVGLSRVIHGMSKEYLMLNFFSKINLKTNTPHYAILFSAIATILFTLFGDIEFTAELCNFSVFASFLIINLALIRSRYIKHRHELFHEPLNFGKFPMLALLGFFSTIFLIGNMTANSLFGGIILTVIGIPIYYFLQKGNAKH
ncbi:MAG: amino acid permease [archaeon]